MTILQKHIVFIPLFCIAYIAVFGGCVTLLWNWLMPALFGLNEICFWQAAGLLVLCKILFGGLGGHHAGGHHCGHRCHHDKSCSSGSLREKWECMSQEERERIIAMHGEAKE